MGSTFWERKVYGWVIALSVAFLVLTVVAMFAYPGGTYSDASTRGYSFFGNFFSELGMLHTHLGAPKTFSLVLFVIAMALVAVGQTLFFLAFPRAFRRTGAARTFGTLGAVLGILSAVCFVGVAVFPSDVNLPLHTEAVMWAFRLFPSAVLCCILMLFTDLGIRHPWGWRLMGFLFLLLVYLLLLQFGPGIHGDAGRIIQAVGQKIIVYASILTTLFLAWGMLRRT